MLLLIQSVLVVLCCTALSLGSQHVPCNGPQDGLDPPCCEQTISGVLNRYTPLNACRLFRQTTPLASFGPGVHHCPAGQLFSTKVCRCVRSGGEPGVSVQCRVAPVKCDERMSNLCLARGRVCQYGWCVCPPSTEDCNGVCVRINILPCWCGGHVCPNRNSRCNRKTKVCEPCKEDATGECKPIVMEPPKGACVDKTGGKRDPPCCVRRISGQDFDDINRYTPVKGTGCKTFKHVAVNNPDVAEGTHTCGEGLAFSTEICGCEWQHKVKCFDP